MRRFFCALILTFGLVRGAWAAPADEARPTVGDWGIDGCLTCHVPFDGDFQDYVRLLKESGVRWVRERQVVLDEADLTGSANPLVRRLRAMQAAGLHVVAFASTPNVRYEQAGDQLPENLQAVYAACFRQARNAAGLVDAWEMSGEPDLGYCRDLPDRLTAYNKAMYLGLHDGAAAAGKPTIVLMGALGMEPGPWLDRAVRNGLLDYTDAYNFHFYGLAADLPGDIEAHRAVLQAAFPASKSPVRHGRAGVKFPRSQQAGESVSLPLWITECGMKAVAPDDFYNPWRRAAQAAFARETAAAAWADPDVAMFMPFILVHAKDPHAMTVRPDFPLPAWTAYADYVRGHPWPGRTLAQVSPAPNRVVMQWLPDNTTTVPHKVAGTYRFLGDAPVRGVLRIYNFENKPVTGRVEAERPSQVRLEAPALTGGWFGRLRSAKLVVPAGGVVKLPLAFTPDATGYFREEWSAAFVRGDGRRSPVVFGLERWPEAKDFSGAPLDLRPVVGAGLLSERKTPGKPVGPWTPMDGLECVSATSEGAVFQVGRITRDPLHPPVAVAAVDGLPKKGFVRLQLDRPMGSGAGVQVSLVDAMARRFTIWENLGANYQRPSSDVWLNLADFNLYSWGRVGADSRFNPGLVREVQLRFFFRKANDPVEVRLSFMTAKASGTRR